MGLPCINSIAADEYAHQQGIEAEQDAYVESLVEDLLQGGSVNGKDASDILTDWVWTHFDSIIDTLRANAAEERAMDMGL